MAEWKKVLVSGSTIDVAALQVGSTAITSTPAELNLLDGVSGLVQADFTKLAAIDSTAAEIDVLDGVTAGTAAASKAVVLDANKDLGTIRDISGSGALFSGTIAANAFSGDGSALTGVAAGSLDIDNFSELDAAPHATQDEFLVSDNGTEKRVSMTNVANGAFALVSGDATVASGGALTIAANSVEGTMLNTNSADTSTIELSSDTLSVLKVPNDLTVDNATIALNSGTTFNGSGAVTISVKDGGIDADALASSVAGAGLAGGGGTVLSVGGGAGITANANDVAVTAAQTAITSLINSSLTKIGTATDQEYVDFSTSNEVNVKINDTERLSVTAAGVDITGAATVSTNLTVSGNLTVAGTTTEVQTTNLNVEDKFILLNSGSSTATEESGIIFGGANGSANTGTALIWNGDYNSNDGRLAISNTVASNATSATVNYFIAGVFDGTVADAATAQADHRGNIRVDSSNDIFIYV